MQKYLDCKSRQGIEKLNLKKKKEVNIHGKRKQGHYYKTKLLDNDLFFSVYYVNLISFCFKKE